MRHREMAVQSSNHIIVVMNKVDLIPPAERAQTILSAEHLLRNKLLGTKFGDACYVAVAAAVGGGGTSTLPSSTCLPTIGLDTLIQYLQEKAEPRPHRCSGDPFCFAIDHCFAVRGQGTILTGTVLRGSISVNDKVELPELQTTRVVKSLQMFRKPVRHAQQGDRLGICLTGLDPGTMERGIAVQPSSAVKVEAAVAVVRQALFSGGQAASGRLYHITVGHTTVMAEVHFFGAEEMAGVSEEPSDGEGTHSVPILPFSWDVAYKFQDCLVAETVLGLKKPGLQFALLMFQLPVWCQLPALALGSRLDSTSTNSIGGGGSSIRGKSKGRSSGVQPACRLAFYCRLLEACEPGRLPRIYKDKEKVGIIVRPGESVALGEGRSGSMNAIGGGMFTKDTDISRFLGMIVVTENGDLGEVVSSFGKNGRFKVSFPLGAELQEGQRLILRFRRFVHDASKSMSQAHLVDQFSAARKMGLAGVTPKVPAGSGCQAKIHRQGTIDKLKGEEVQVGRWLMATVSGMFSSEEDIRLYSSTQVRTESGDEGKILGPFGKAGKCKVIFKNGTAGPSGAKVWMVENQISPKEIARVHLR